MVQLGIAVAPMRLIFIITMICFIVITIGSVQPWVVEGLMAPIVIGGIGARTIGRRPICIIAVVVVVVVVVVLLLLMLFALIAGLAAPIVSLRSFIMTIVAWWSGVAPVVTLRSFIMLRVPWWPCIAPNMALVFIVMAPWGPVMSTVMWAMAMMVVTTAISWCRAWRRINTCWVVGVRRAWRAWVATAPMSKIVDGVLNVRHLSVHEQHVVVDVVELIIKAGRSKRCLTAWFARQCWPLVMNSSSPSNMGSLSLPESFMVGLDPLPLIMLAQEPIVGIGTNDQVGMTTLAYRWWPVWMNDTTQRATGKHTRDKNTRKRLRRWIGMESGKLNEKIKR